MVFLRSFAEDQDQFPPNDPGQTPAPTTTPTPPTQTPNSVFTPNVSAFVNYVNQNKGHGGGGGYGGGGNDFPMFNIGPAPKFVAPRFSAPTAESVLQSPGYKFREEAGRNALERSSAARGVLRTGGTLKDLIEYGQNFASNEYNNEFNRALSGFQANYQGTKDEFAPLLAQWQLLSNAELQKGLAQYNRHTMWDAPRFGGGGGGNNVYDEEPPPPPA